MHAPLALSECERISAHARFEELDFKCPIYDFSRLPNELIKTIVVQASPPVCVDVITVVDPRRIAIDRHAKANGMTLRGAAQYEM